jgi:hypothetical protein
MCLDPSQRPPHGRSATTPQAALLERGAWAAANWADPWAVAAPLLGFASALFAFSLLLPRVLLLGGSTVLNLSLLTSDAWVRLGLGRYGVAVQCGGAL